MTNVSVCVRFRPLNASEIRQGAKPSCIRRSDEQSFVFKDEKEGEFTFCFDRIYYEDSTQADVFDFLALPIVKDAMNAINGTILTYGQTGAGKTHSMEGPSMITSDQQQKGILPRVVESIFASIEAADATSEFIIKLSMVEIYMERIRDLFNRSKDNLQVKEDKANGIFVSGATEINCAIFLTGIQNSLVFYKNLWVGIPEQLYFAVVHQVPSMPQRACLRCALVPEQSKSGINLKLMLSEANKSWKN